jgi:dihydrofolate reductase
MRRLRYQVAASLDGYIAGPKGEADWIPMDPEIDFKALFAQFDTFLMGRRTYEALAGQGGVEMFSGKKVVVVSRTLKPAEHPKVTVVSTRVAEAVAALRKQPGKDIWLFGGGELFRSLLELGLVDTVEVAVLPVLLGAGIPLLPAPSPRATLTLTRHRVYRKTGTVLLEYAVERGRRP